MKTQNTASEPGSLLARKLARVRHCMQADGATAMLLMENSRTRYVTGYQRYYAATHINPVHATVVTPDPRPLLLLPPHILPSATFFPNSDAAVFPPGFDARIATIAKLLSGHEVVAIEFDYLNFNFVEALKAALPKVRFVDASAIMRAATRVKFDEEIEFLKKAAELVDAGVKAAVEAIKPGVTEIAVAAAASIPMLEGGAEFVHHMTIRSGPHANGLFPVPTDRRFQEGDCVQIDLGCMVEGYVGDINRTVFVGKPSQEQRELFRVAQCMLEACIGATRAGVSSRAIWNAAFDTAKSRKMESLIAIPFVAHGIGIVLQEAPVIDAASDMTLEENMVLALEPGLYSPIGACRPEDMVRVSKTGCDVLTKFPRDYDLMSRS